MRLIDADALCANLDGMMAVSPTGYIHGDTIADMIGDAPTIGPERKMGKWTVEDCHAATYKYCCSNCRAHHRAMYDYCPSCGADMRGEQG